ncbi:MAG: dephospho-CoA kinase [Rhodothermales bacterium]
MSTSHTFVLGVTGGIGSGKTTVCRLLETHGARVFYADDEAKQLMHRADVRADVEALLGDTSYDTSGHLNRGWVAQRVFGHPDRLAALNAIVHPRVYDALDAAILQAQADGVALFVYESALLVQAGSTARERLDGLLVVDAPITDRLARVTNRDGSAEADVQARMDRQLAATAMRAEADFIIDNTGSLADLEAQVAALVQRLAEATAQSGTGVDGSKSSST